MTELERNIDSIKSEIEQKVIPENIRIGFTVFGVTGTYTGEEE